MGSAHDEDGRQAQDKAQENQRDNLRWLVDDGNDD